MTLLRQCPFHVMKSLATKTQVFNEVLKDSTYEGQNVRVHVKRFMSAGIKERTPVQYNTAYQESSIITC